MEMSTLLTCNLSQSQTAVYDVATILAGDVYVVDMQPLPDSCVCILLDLDGDVYVIVLQPLPDMIVSSNFGRLSC